jgi:zinc protease
VTASLAALLWVAALGLAETVGDHALFSEAQAGIAATAARLLVRGASRRPGDDPERALSLTGGALRTASGPDLTGFLAEVPPESVPLAVQLLADRLTRPLVADPAAWDREHGRGEPPTVPPLSAASRELWAAAYTSHPYGWPPAGWPEDVRGVTPEDCRQAAATRFSPERAVIVVTSPAPAADTHRLVRRSFLRWRRQPPPGPAPWPEAPQRGERRVTTRVPGSPESAWLAGFHVSEAAHADTPALEVLARVLVQGQGGRLWQRLVEEDGLASGVTVTLHRRERPSLLTVEVQAQGDPRRLEASALAELERVRVEPCAERDLARARGTLELEHALDLAQPWTLARTVAEAELVLGGWKSAWERPAAWQSVTAEDVRRVAQAHLHPDNRTVVLLLPDGPPGKTAGRGPPGAWAAR